jgi:hypothetical protein
LLRQKPYRTRHSLQPQKGDRILQTFPGRDRLPVRKEAKT